MKKLLMLTLALVLISPAGPASAGQNSAIGLFVDDSHSLNYIAPEPMQVFDMYIWILPGSEGFMAADFLIKYPPNIVIENTELNEMLIPPLGDIETGLAICFTECQMDWMPVVRQTLYAVDSEKSIISIGGQEFYEGKAVYTDCTEGYPISDLLVLTDLYINYTASEAPQVGADKVSWGLIKGEYMEEEEEENSE
jgi:hypothetical protein